MRCVSHPLLLLLLLPPVGRSLGQGTWSGCRCLQSAPAWLPPAPWTFCPRLPQLLLLLGAWGCWPQGRHWCPVETQSRSQGWLLLQVV
jgi:hypothetical protein